MKDWLRALSILIAFGTVALAMGCSSDESTTTASAASGGDAASSTAAAATGGQTSSGSGGAGAAGGAPTASSSGQGGGGGADGGCAGKACGSACLTRGGEGMCDPGGSCVILPVQCPGYAPCTGVQCGTACSSCDPKDPTCVPARGTVCDITQFCIYPPPACD